MVQMLVGEVGNKKDFTKWNKYIGIGVQMEIILLVPVLQETSAGTSLVAQWLRIHLAMKETRVDPWSGN